MATLTVAELDIPIDIALLSRSAHQDARRRGARPHFCAKIGA
jgi:hypothetical protein